MPPKSAPAPYAPTRSPAPAFERSNSSAYAGTSGVSAVKSSASTKMIELTRTSSRRMRTRICAQRKCTEPVATSSGFPTDHRRSDNHSESHQPQTLRTRCIGDSMDRTATGQAPVDQFGAICGEISRGASRDVARSSLEASPRTQKCTEPVAPSSGFPTDRRRSDCRSESHQPLALRTRCIAHSRGTPELVKALETPLLANCALFFSQQLMLRLDALCSDVLERRKTAGREGPAARVRRAGNAFVHLPDEPSASA